MFDAGNLFVVLLALPAFIVGVISARAFTYWTDSRFVAWSVIVAAILFASVPAFVSWFLLANPSAATLMLPMTAPFAGFGFGCAIGAWRTLDAGGWSSRYDRFDR